MPADGDAFLETSLTRKGLSRPPAASIPTKASFSRTRTASFSRPFWGLSENSNPDISAENESGKSSQFGSHINPTLTYLRYRQVANLRAVEFSDTPFFCS